MSGTVEKNHNLLISISLTCVFICSTEWHCHQHRVHSGKWVDN